MANTKEHLSGGRIQGASTDSTFAAPPQTGWKVVARGKVTGGTSTNVDGVDTGCLLYTSPSPRD